MAHPEVRGENLRRILLIDDSERDRRWLRNRLMAEPFEVIEVASGLQGLALGHAVLPDLILLDLALPDCDGIEVLRRLKSEPRTSSIPVIVVSVPTEATDKAQVLDLGAIDYVSKPYDTVELQARVRAALRIKQAYDRLERRTHIDGLTGLANRNSLEARLTTEWDLHHRHGSSLAVWIADLDHLKAINEEHGHGIGDEVLRRTAGILRESVRASDMVARYGGEEFVVLAPHCGLIGALKTAERFRLRLASQPWGQVTGSACVAVPVTMTVSVGVSSMPENAAASPAELLAHACWALSQAKAQGCDKVAGPSRDGPGATACSHARTPAFGPPLSLEPEPDRPIRRWR